MKKQNKKKKKRPTDLYFYLITQHTKDNEKYFGPFKSFKKAEKYLKKNCNYYYQYTIDKVNLNNCDISCEHEGDPAKTYYKVVPKDFVDHNHYGMDWDITTEDSATLYISWPGIPWNFHIDRDGNEIQVKTHPDGHNKDAFTNLGDLTQDQKIYAYLALNGDPETMKRIE